MLEGRQLAVRCARLLDEAKAEEIVVLDLRKLTDVTDYFVIATARTRRQLQSTARRLQEQLKKLTGHAPAIEGYQDGE